MKFCAQNGAITIADSHTLTNNPQLLFKSDSQVAGYKILEPLLYELDMFFTSFDEARLIDQSIGQKSNLQGLPQNDFIVSFLESLSQKFWQNKNPRVFGVTVHDGAFVLYRDAFGNVTGPVMVRSCFMSGETIDLVGAGDSFRAGLVTYIVKNISDFKTGKINIYEAVQMANLFASLYIKAPLTDRYANFVEYEKLLHKIKTH